MHKGTPRSPANIWIGTLITIGTMKNKPLANSYTGTSHIIIVILQRYRYIRSTRWMCVRVCVLASVDR